MPVNVKRIDKINEEVKKQLAEIIRELKDPRICPLTSIISVSVTNDYSQAKVKVSVYDESDTVRTETVAALNYASGFIAREVGNRMDIRKKPKFIFALDNSIEYSVHISSVLSKLNITPTNETEDSSNE